LKWLHQRQTADYGRVIEPPQMPTSAGMLGRLLGFNPKPKDKK